MGPLSDGDASASASVNASQPALPPCTLGAAAASVASLGFVPPGYKQLACRPAGHDCEGPFGVAGSCCAGLLCAHGVPGRASPAGVCVAWCAKELEPCAADRDCCQLWGRLVCNPSLQLCVAPEVEFKWPGEGPPTS